MKLTRKVLVASLLAVSLGLASCEKDFLDVNTNPNAPLSSTPELVLPSGQAAVAYTMGNQFQILGNFWSQNWTQSLQSNQYKQLDRYNVTQNDYDRPWQYLYAGALQDFKYVQTKAQGDSANFAAIAGLMTAYTYQVLVDAYDKVPFSEALQGANNTQPRYDEGQAVYDALLPLINSSVQRINEASKVQIGSSDLIFQGDMGKWRRFANTLKLKIFLRQIYARPALAQDSIRAMYSRGAEFLAGNEDAEVKFFDVNTNRNPLYETEFGNSTITTNIIASNTALDYLKQTQDPRIRLFYDKPAADTSAAFTGEDQGRAALPGTQAVNIDEYSRPSQFIAGPTTAVPLISGAESLFLQAEAAARGLANGATAQGLYEDAIRASFNYFMQSGADTFIAQPTVSLGGITDPEAQLERIITQKWVALNGRQGFEAWTELRRTGYPSFIRPSLSSVLPNGTLPNRVPYPISEAQRNANAPTLVRVEVPVWWDKRN